LDRTPQRRHRRTSAQKIMDKPQDTDAAMTAQTTNATAVDLPRLVRPFIADEAPLGTIVHIGRNTPDERIAHSEFHSYLFQYFEQLTSGQTGWGVDFNAWLEMTRGWKHHGRKKYERIMSIGEMINSEPNYPAQLPPRAGSNPTEDFIGG